MRNSAIIVQLIAATEALEVKRLMWEDWGTGWTNPDKNLYSMGRQAGDWNISPRSYNGASDLDFWMGYGGG